jgi:hypothetical protein
MKKKKKKKNVRRLCRLFSPLHLLNFHCVLVLRDNRNIIGLNNAEKLKSLGKQGITISKKKQVLQLYHNGSF